jgi:hypothetical protein
MQLAHLLEKRLEDVVLDPHRGGTVLDALLTCPPGVPIPVKDDYPAAAELAEERVFGGISSGHPG